jgi:hypothetical protein
MGSEPLAHKRYRLEEPLGRGSAGTVYRAHDLELDRPVALKLLHSLTADDIFRLKKEFRSLAEVTHPNLVELYDLVASGDQWFFTMELVDGRNFVDTFRGDRSRSHAVDFEQLRGAIRQLVAALEAMHGRHKLHRDIKPTNVLVDAAGRVVVVDFGLVTNQLSRGSLESGSGVLVGTLAYMAPEQIWGNVSPASDWYAVGAMLYETLTGVPPRDRDGLHAIVEGRAWTPPAPRALAPETPADIDALVMALLSTRPEDRPGPAETLARLSSTPSPPALDVPRVAAAPFVGRDEELDRLRRAFAPTRERRLHLVTIQGASGIGKTTLVEHFLERFEQVEGNLVLRARCHPRESVPFRAVDGLIDDLARFLCLEPKESLPAFLPEGSGMLPLLFPVLGRVCPQTTAPVGEPHEVRRAAFAALRALLQRVAARHPTVAWIDDLQWGDLDSAALLRELLRAPDPPSLTLILSFRADAGEGRALVADVVAPLEATPEMLLQIALSPLTDRDTRRLADELLGGSGDAAAVAAESGGNPLILGELARHQAAASAGAVPGAHAVPFIDVVAARIEPLRAAPRRVLDLVSIAGEPMSERLLYRLGLSTENVDDAVRTLRRRCLLRTAGRAGEVAYEPYHHRIGEMVSALLAPDSRRVLHREIAETLERLPDANPQQLVEHYLRAGDLGRAGELAYASAEKAVAAMAFHGAARLYRQALELETTACPSWLLREKLGDALIGAGRSGEAAGWLAAAARERAERRPDDLDALRLKRRAAEYYLRGGLHVEGLAALQEVLSALGLRYGRSTTSALASLMGNRMRVALLRRLQRARPATRLSPFERERLEACWSAGIGLSLFDQVRAAAFQARHALLAQRAGDQQHLARALATEGLLLAWEGGARKRRRAMQLRRQGERLARRAENPNIRAHGVLMNAASAYYELRLRDALELCAEGERLCREECVGAVWEIANLQVLTGNTLACLGDLPRLRAYMPETLRQARERDDRYCLVIARLGYANVLWLAADRPDEARRQAEEALAGPFPSSFAWQLYQGALALAQIHLYVGDGVAGWEQMRKACAELRRRFMLRFLTTRVEMHYLSARCALVRARSETGRARQAMLRFALRSARRIDAEDAPWVGPFADVLRAGVLGLTDRRDAAVQRLEDAALGFDELAMALHAAAARWQAGRSRDDEAGRRMHAQAEGWMRAQGVAHPERMASMLAPVV